MTLKHIVGLAVVSIAIVLGLIWLAARTYREVEVAKGEAQALRALHGTPEQIEARDERAGRTRRARESLPRAPASPAPRPIQKPVEPVARPAGVAVQKRPRREAPQQPVQPVVAPEPEPEPLTRDGVLARVVKDYEERVRGIREQEQARYEQAAGPKLRAYTYQTDFAACLRHVAGAKDSLRQLASQVQRVAPLEVELQSLQQKILGLQTDYLRERARAETAYKNAKIRASATDRPWSLAPASFQPSYEMRRLDSQIRAAQEQARTIQTTLSGLQMQVRQWRAQEQNWRNAEQRELQALVGQRDSRIKVRLEALWQEPWACYVYTRKGLEGTIAEHEETVKTKGAVVSMLEKAGQVEKAEALRDELSAVEARRERLAAKLEVLNDTFLSEHYPATMAAEAAE